MEILVKRIWKKQSNNGTGFAGGKMYINNVDFCFTIEDEDRNLKSSMSLEQISSIKKYGITAIPTGRYEVAMTFSNRFKEYMPQILSVPGYEGVRIHTANTSKDVEGCIGVAMESSSDGFAGNSRAAYSKLLSALKKVEKKEKIFITIE